GYWWAISIHPDDSGEPEIVYVHGNEVTRLTDDWPYHVGEFDLLQHIDTKAWPQKGKLTYEQLLDENYAVNPATVHEGYWWAINYEDMEPTIVLIGKDAVYRVDAEVRLDEFEFLMPIDTSGWPKEATYLDN
ncbi:hypothetical protein, partial [Mesorhizobium sp. M2A.F.Ca.ET.037.01.1.1]